MALECPAMSRLRRILAPTLLAAIACGFILYFDLFSYFGDPVRRGKEATPLVIVSLKDQPIAYGSAFCIDASGLYITNAHVVSASKSLGGEIKIALLTRSGEKEQRSFSAEVLRSDPKLDLALLRVKTDIAMPALRLGSDETVTETLPLMIFGYPFGAQLSPSTYPPSPSVNTAKVSALRTIDGRLDAIQLDGNLNPGNSGGPVLDPKGRVVGVVVAGVRGAGINLAIPVGRLKDFLDSPAIAFDPAPVEFLKLFEEIEWTTTLGPGLPTSRVPTDIEVVYLFEYGSNNARQVVAERTGPGVYTARFSAMSNIVRPTMKVEVRLAGGSAVKGNVHDFKFSINGKTFWLSNIRSLDRKANRVLLGDGQIGTGPVILAGPIELDSKAYEAGAIESLTVESINGLPDRGEIDVTVQINRGHSLLGSMKKLVLLKDVRQFTGPRSVTTPTPSVVLRDDNPVAYSRGIEAGDVLKPVVGRSEASGSIRPPTLRIKDAVVTAGAGKPPSADQRPEGLRLIPTPKDLSPTCAAFSRDGEWLAVGSPQGFIHLFESTTLAPLRQIRQPDRLGSALAFSNDGRMLLFGSLFGRLVGANLVSMKARPLIEDKTSSIEHFTLSPDGTQAMILDARQGLKLWDLSTGKPVREFWKGMGRPLTYTTDWSKLLLTQREERSPRTMIQLLDLKTGASLWDVKDPNAANVAGSSVLAASKSCVVVFVDGTVSIRSLGDGSEKQRFKLPSSPFRAAISPDQTLIVTASSRKLEAFDLSDGRARAQVEFHPNSASQLVFSPDGQSVAVTGEGSAVLWNQARAVALRQGLDTRKEPETTLVRMLPGKIHAITPAGAGRFLLLTLPDTRQLAVFDANAGDVVEFVSLLSEKVLVAGGARSFLLVYPEQGIVERWNLSTRDREASGPLTVRGKAIAVAMGSATEGPALLAWSDNPIEGPRLTFIDPVGLKALKIPEFNTLLADGQVGKNVAGPMTIPSPAQVPGDDLTSFDLRASADGSLFTARRSGHGGWIVRKGNIVGTHQGFGSDPLLPDPNGMMIYENRVGVCDLAGKVVVNADETNNLRPLSLPCDDPAFCLAVKGLTPYRFAPRRPSDPRVSVGVSVLAVGNPTPLFTIDGLTEMDDLPETFGWWNSANLAGDHRFRYIREANLFVTIPSTNDRLVLRSLDLSKALNAVGGDYLVVTSARSLFGSPGETLKHQIEAVSRARGLKFSMPKGPSGATLTPEGALQWSIPPDVSRDDQTMVIICETSSKKSTFHSLTIRMR
jgi:WD40 repeat protein